LTWSKIARIVWSETVVAAWVVVAVVVAGMLPIDGTGVGVWIQYNSA
jgi:hypothetical protein